MKSWAIVLALVSFAPLFSEEKEEEVALRRVHAHLLINDTLSAVEEAKRSLEKFPHCKSLQTALIRALSEQGMDSEAIEQLVTMLDADKDEIKNRHLLEVIAWGVLNKGRDSSQLSIRLNSLLGASITHDAKAIPVLLEQLQSSNAFLRSLAVHLCTTFGDDPLKRELARMLKEEKIWYVRLEVIKAVGMMRMTSLRSELKEIIGATKTLAEEKATAMVALVNMYENVEKEELISLVKSDRAGHRLLACQIVSHLNLVEQADVIFPLLNDGSPDVRMHALTAMGLLRIKDHKNKPFIEWITPFLSDPAPEVAITAAWVALISGEKVGEKKLKNWMKSEHPEWRKMASAAVAASGKEGVALALKTLKRTTDPYVRVNLALGLIGQRQETSYACDCLYFVLQEKKDSLWMWDKGHPLFRSLSQSSVKHIEQIPNYPLVVDQMVRLDLLSVLSIMRYSKAEELVKSYLQNQAWGTAGAAAATLLEEGDEEALVLVQKLLNDPDEKIRVQAALILALLGSDPSGVKVLQEAYPTLDRDMKVQVLEALGHIGDPQSIPFLINILQEPFQVLRVVAASALIQCLYH